MQIIREHTGLQFINEYKIKIAVLTSQQEKKTGNGTRLVMGECIKVKDAYQWICPYDFMIVVYEQNCVGFTDEQYKILLWHELKHIGVKDEGPEPEYYIVPHDYEEFDDIIKAYGLDWSRQEG